MAGSTVFHRRGQPFGTRFQGYAQKRHVWVCRECRCWHEKDPAAVKPGFCTGCGRPASSFLHFDSAGEARWYMSLWLQQEQGLVTDLEHHPRYPVAIDGPSGPKVITTYTADARYRRVQTGEIVIGDYKPSDERAQDPRFKLVRKMVEHQHGIRITVVTG